MRFMVVAYSAGGQSGITYIGAASSELRFPITHIANCLLSARNATD